MNAATNWTPGIVALSVAVTMGVFLLLRSRSGASLPAVEHSRKEELERQKAALYALLRDHALRGEHADPAWVAERDRLELAAATVLRDLDAVSPDTAPAASATPAQGTAAAPAASTRPQTWGERNPRLSGAAWGAGVVLFLGAMFYGVQQSANPRAEGQSITGGHVYRGTRIPGLVGRFVYADYMSMRAWAVREDRQGGKHEVVTLARVPGQPSSFAEEPDGELLVTCFGGRNGRILRLVPAAK